MRAFIDTTCISKARIPAFTHGLLYSSSGPQFPGLEIGPNSQAGARPTGTPGDEDGAQEDDDMGDVMAFFL